ncbi:MAG: hypothetical protein K9H61_07915 [Bacteroidia bacterium]|nr:hypothetical protein [Bacteroidia bacterium]MCF8427652.1 hypothetical protein [Bacteroidia bacterium]MCF8446908.1 hypothetical protein [Bacteroidia bacterium]
MKFVLLPLLLFACLKQNAHAQLIGKPFGAEAIFLGKIACLSSGGFESFNNPSLLQNLLKNNWCVYQEIPFLEPTFCTSGISYATKVKKSSLGFGLIQSGNDIFKQQIFNFSIAKTLHKNFQLGLGFNYLRTQQIQLGSKSNITANLGGQIVITPKIKLGFYCGNILQARYKLEKLEPITSLYRLAISYSLNSNLIVVAEQEQLGVTSSTSKIGLQYQVNKDFKLLAGFNLKPLQIGLGIKLNRKYLHYLIGFQFHQNLPISPVYELQLEREVKK